MAIDSERYAFGLDTEQYSSSPTTDYVQKLMDWRVAALYSPVISFVFVRAGISWGYKDVRFDYNWQGVRKMDEYRDECDAWNTIFGQQRRPCGRGAYHVLYPSQDPIAQADNFLNIVSPVADWEHDRLVIDLEVHSGQDRRTVTDCTKRFAYACHAETGRYPLLYTRAIWLGEYAYPHELSFMDLWLAEYLYPQTPYTPEKEPPPRIPSPFSNWLCQQTGDHCKPIGSPVKKVMDYCRWNGGADVVADYFGFDVELSENEKLRRLKYAHMLTREEWIDYLWAKHPELHGYEEFPYWKKLRKLWLAHPELH